MILRYTPCPVNSGVPALAGAVIVPRPLLAVQITGPSGYRLRDGLLDTGADATLTLKSPRVEELKPGANDWLLLLQVDSDLDNPGWMWCDTGRIYYWIRREDLMQRRFEKVHLVLQCS